jgi:hypothetical protein
LVATTTYGPQVRCHIPAEVLSFVQIGANAPLDAASATPGAKISGGWMLAAVVGKFFEENFRLDQQ